MKTMIEHDPTNEQAHCIELFDSGKPMVIEAGAGTGKTSTLVMLAQSQPRKYGQYAAFNKAIVTDSASKFPGNVRANTMHSLAFRAIGRQYAHRLNGPRMSSNELAYRLKTQTINLQFGETLKTMRAEFMASLVMKGITRFCQSADTQPGPAHIPYVEGIDMPTDDGKRTYSNNNLVREILKDPLERAWKDLMNPEGQLPFKHDNYLKIWELDNPSIPADFILFDEAQDADPVQLSIVNKQQCQKVFVGDSNQQIYEWRGAQNALSGLESEHRPFLTQSFRFGPEIAEIANQILGWIGAPLRLKGLPSLSGYVGPDILPDCILTRTNASAIRNVLELQRQGRRVHLLGGAREMLSFVRGAEELQKRGSTAHPELACFDSWAAVQEYVEHDPQGSDLALSVKLVDEFGVDAIQAALSRTSPEGRDVVTVSTTHKAKGRQWPAVRLDKDFSPKEDAEPRTLSTAELRLIYVAATRAQFSLDWSAVAREQQLSEQRA